MIMASVQPVERTICFNGLDEAWDTHGVYSIHFEDSQAGQSTFAYAYDIYDELIEDNADLVDLLIDEAQQDLFNLAYDASPNYYAVKGVVTRNEDGTYNFQLPHIEEAYTSPKK